MEGESTTRNRIAHEDATTQPHQQVKFTFKGNQPSPALPVASADPVSASTSGSPSDAVTPNNDQTRNSTTSTSSLSNGTKPQGSETTVNEVDAANTETREDEDEVLADGSGSDDGLTATGQGNGAGEAEGVATTTRDSATPTERPRNRIEDLAQTASDAVPPESPVIPSEAPSRIPSPTPRESTPALSEAPSDTPSIDSSFAGPPPETSAFDLAHPLASYQFANTTLVPVASTSTNPFHFVSWPPQPPEDSWQRTRLPDDDEANVELDREPGYRATPAEIEASRIRAEEKQAKIKARMSQAKGKGKAKEPVAKLPPRAKAMERLSSVDGATPPASKRVRPAKSTLQQEIQKAPEPERPRPLVTKTRFARDLAMALLPDDVQTSLPGGVLPHADFVDLLALPPHFITEEGIPPSAAVSVRQRLPVAKPQPSAASTPAPASAPVTVAPSPAKPATGEALEANGTKRTRDPTDEGRGAPKKKTKEESAEPDSPAPVARSSGPAKPVEYVTQSTTCLSKKIDGQMRCFQCIARVIGHGCCFLGIRSFGVDAQGQIVTPPVYLDSKAPDDIPRFSKPMVTPLNSQFNQLMRTWLAPQLLPIVERERKHAEAPGTKRARLDLSVHSLCDTCNSSILGSEWMCSTCGRVACRTCYEALVDLEKQESRSKAVTMTPVEVQRRKKCIAKKRGEKGLSGEGHRSSQFIAMTRLDKKDLKQLHADLNKWKITHAIVPSDGSAKKFLDNTYLTESPLPDYDLNTHPVHQIPASDMNPAVFLELWLTPAPVLVTDIDLGGLKKWTPSYISNRFPNLELQLQNNKGSETVTAKVPYFFSQFNEDGGPQRGVEAKQTFRTKDFPTARQFKREFQELAEEFYRILPIRDILHPEGPLNFLAHTPINAVQPDVGPRGTNSWAVDAATGTTLLRTDVTDVASLMYWGHHDEATGRELRIRWDVFRADDSDGLRDFCWEVLTKKLPKGTSANKFKETHDDPLLNPCVYLNQRQRETLAATRGIHSHAIYQYPGQLVLIPAGCSYQVSSWSDHLSLTTQFLAGPALGEALKVNDACRFETKERTLWRTDNIQLERQLLYAWYSCQNADEKYVATPLDWRPKNGNKTAEELAREKSSPKPSARSSRS